MSFFKCKDFIKKKNWIDCFYIISIEFISEPGKDYRVEIKESVGEYTSKPGKDYRVTETGVSLYIKWAKPELNNVDGDLRGASFIQSEMISQKKQKEKKKER